MPNDNYDIAKAFKVIENDLIASMIRNLKHHRAEEEKEGKEWTQWQVEQLQALEKYKKENAEKYNKQFKSINAQIGEMIRAAKEAGSSEQEIAILNAIKNGFKATKKSRKELTGEFFKLNERKLDALIKATTDDMKKAETAILRMANDKYRKIIFNAQVYANTGAGTYEKAVDMATRDMLNAGLNCVQYANKARHTLSDYADMAIRTANKRAYLQGEGEKRQEWGISTVIMNKRGNACPKCLPFVGKIIIDDVWSGGKQSDGPYLLMSNAIARGLYHPRCKDSHTTYFAGISAANDSWTKEELAALGQEYEQEQKQQYAERQAERFSRLAEYSLDEDNKRKYAARAKEWKKSFVDGGSKENLTPVANDDVGDYLVSKKQYDDGVKKVQSLEKETDDLLDQYMDAMDTPDEARLEKLHSEKYEELESLREVVKDLKAQLSGKEAKAVRQIEKNFADLTGIPIDEVKMTGLQYDTAEMIYDSYDTVLKKFPELKGNLAKFTYDGVFGDSYASCAILTGGIQAHGDFSNLENLIKKYADDVAKGFHPIGTDHRSIIVHELGHALDGYMTKQRLLGADYNQFGVVSTSSKTAKDMTLKMLGFDRQEIAEELKRQGLKTFERRDILEQREKEFIAKHVSGYATGYDSDGNASTNYPEREFFAECFAEYIMSDNPREVARIFGEIIETAWGR